LYLKPLNRGDRYFYSSVSKRRISLKNEILWLLFKISNQISQLVQADYDQMLTMPNLT
jgi:hypothetical protein